MRKLILMMGLPRSGKSTYSRKLIAEGAVVVSPDAIRLALYGQNFCQEAEDFVWAIARKMTASLFLADHETVVLDATNLSIKLRDEWRKLADKTELIFIDTEKNICIERAKIDGREDLIPIIQRMSIRMEMPQKRENAQYVKGEGLLEE